MKDKKHKHIKDILEDYIDLQDELIELPLLIEKAQKKFGQWLLPGENAVYAEDEAEGLFKAYTTIKKLEDRRTEIHEELRETEEILSGFLITLKDGKVSYERKDNNDKSKHTFLFWLEDGIVKCNR